MISTPYSQYILIFSIACAVFAAVVLAARTRRISSRVLILSSLGVYVVGQFAVLRFVSAQNPREAEAAVRTLYLITALGAAPWALLATQIYRRQEWQRLRGRIAFVGAVAVLGVALATLVGSDLVLSGEVGQHEDDHHPIAPLGLAGKLLLVYLTAVATYVLTQVEMLLRASLRVSERGPKLMVGLTGVAVIVYVYVATESFLYGRVDAYQLVMSSVPASLACLVAGGIGLRRSLDDMRLPLGRGVVYSSFTLFILGLMMILLGLLSRLAAIMGVSVDRTFFLATSVLAAAAAIVLWISPTWKRRVSVFIDENFYVNRHDYRRQWERLSRGIRPTADREELVTAISETVRPMLGASDLQVAILNPVAGQYVVYDGTGRILPSYLIAMEGPAARHIRRRNEAIPLADLDADLDLVPAYLEIETLAKDLQTVVIAPMVSGGQLVGILFFSRTQHGGPYSPEDLSLMTVIGSEIASSVYGHLLLRWVEERREGEALVKLSSFVLHDLKNCVSAIQGAVEGARAHMDEPEFRRDLLISLSSAGQRMMGLMDRLSEVRASPRPSLVRDEPCKIEGILTDALRHSGVDAAPGIRVRVDCAPGLLTHGDPEMLERVFINLCRNAADAMEGNGQLDIRAHSDGNGSIDVDVSDTGCGMTPAYIAESLFRPFASTKQNGLGIGLYQCKNIVDEHGGRIRVESGTEGGTRVQVRLPAATEAQPTCETDS